MKKGKKNRAKAHPMIGLKDIQRWIALEKEGKLNMAGFIKMMRMGGYKLRLKEPLSPEEISKLSVSEFLSKIHVNLELTQSKRNATTPCIKANSSQRMDMFQSQLESMTVPVNADYPTVCSNMYHDIYTHSSCIRQLKGKIRVIAKFHYQFRTIYVYEHNGLFDIFDSDGYIDSNGYACKEMTDLKHLPLNEDVDLDQDDFYLKYPKQFDPTARTIGIGANVVTMVSTNFDNSGDPSPVSESFVKKFYILKTKNINIHLSGKTIVSKYPKLFPEIGKLLTENILFKVVEDNGYISQLAQNASLPSGGEDDTIMVEPNTYISSIEVYCNNPIDNPHLEELRQELLKFRTDVYNCLVRLTDYYPNKCSSAIMCYKGNFQHQLFHTEGKELVYPLIKMKTISISKPKTGSKFSNMFKPDPVHSNMSLKCA